MKVYLIFIVGFLSGIFMQLMIAGHKVLEKLDMIYNSNKALLDYFHKVLN